MEVSFSTFGKSQGSSFGKAVRFSKPTAPIGREFLERPSTTSSRSCSFGIGERSKLINAGNVDIPPPTAYTITPEPGVGAVFLGKPKTEFSHKRVSEQPGPGAYNPYLYEKTQPSYSLYPRLNTKTRPNSPGPCAYNIKYTLLYKSAAGGFIPKSYRSKSFADKQKSASPGPGAYTITSCFNDKRTNSYLAH